MEENIFEEEWKDFLIVAKNQNPDDEPWTEDEIEIMRLCWLAGSKTMFNQVQRCLRENDQVRYRKVERQLNDFAGASSAR